LKNSRKRHQDSPLWLAHEHECAAILDHAPLGDGIAPTDAISPKAIDSEIDAVDPAQKYAAVPARITSTMELTSGREFLHVRSDSLQLELLTTASRLTQKLNSLSI
jgi:hypothetical protein